MTSNKNKKGVTIIELLLVIALLGIITIVIYSIFFSGQKSFIVSKDIGFSQQDSRFITDLVNNELRNSREVGLSENLTLDHDTKDINKISFNDNKLYIVNLNKPDETRIYENSIQTLEFKPIGRGDGTNLGNILELKIVSNEGSQTKEFIVNITFENGEIMNFPNDVAKTNEIYYTKYE